MPKNEFIKPNFPEKPEEPEEPEEPIEKISIQKEETIFTNQIKRKKLQFVDVSLKAQTFLTYGSNIALLNNDNDFDQAIFLQSITDLGLDIETPDEKTKHKVKFHFTQRMNLVLGSPETTEIITPEKVKIGQGVTEYSNHSTIKRSILWMREAWMKIYSESQESYVQLGCFPKKIGLGLILGNNYRMGNPLLQNNSEIFVDQYRPGIQFNTQFKNNRYSLSGYFGLQHTKTTSINQQTGIKKNQELQDDLTTRSTKSTITGLQNSFIASIEGTKNIITEKVSLSIKPFVLYQHDPSQTVEFFADSTSKIWTAGASCNFACKKLFGTIDLAAQLGFQQVKAWDRNVSTQEGTKSLIHLFRKELVTSTTWETSDVFPDDQDMSLQYAAGEEFAGNINGIAPGYHNFKNSYSRFRKPYKNSLSGLLFAADLGYKLNENVTFGGIIGAISGGKNPNDSTEKAMLYRLDDSWDTVRKDSEGSYTGFQGINSLYVGNNVRSYYLLRSNRLAQGLTTNPELTSNVCTNLGYIGVGMKYEKELGDKKSWYLQPNAIFMMQTNKTEFGYDPTLHDTYSPATMLPANEKFVAALKELPTPLGVELNASFKFNDSEYLSIYGSFSCFLPGSHYNKVKSLSYKEQGKVIPLKNQLIIEAKNTSGIETAEQNTVTLLNHASFTGYLGISLNFDSLAEFFTAQKRKHKKR